MTVDDSTSAVPADDCQLPKELEMLADVIADILAREYLREQELLD